MNVGDHPASNRSCKTGFRSFGDRRSRRRFVRDFIENAIKIMELTFFFQRVPKWEPQKINVSGLGFILDSTLITLPTSFHHFAQFTGNVRQFPTSKLDRFKQANLKKSLKNGISHFLVYLAVNIHSRSQWLCEIMCILPFAVFIFIIMPLIYTTISYYFIPTPANPVTMYFLRSTKARIGGIA